MPSRAGYFKADAEKLVSFPLSLLHQLSDNRDIDSEQISPGVLLGKHSAPRAVGKLCL